MEKSNEVVNYYPKISAQEAKQTNKKKQTNKQSNLLILTVSCEKSSCSIRSKKKKQNKTNKQTNKTKEKKGLGNS